MGVKWGTVRVQWGYRGGTVRVQWGYSEGAVGVQRWYSEGTMYPNLRSPKEEGIYLDRRRMLFPMFSVCSRSIS